VKDLAPITMGVNFPHVLVLGSHTGIKTFVEALNSHGLTPQPGSREDLPKYMEKETATWGRVVRKRKITAD